MPNTNPFEFEITTSPVEMSVEPAEIASPPLALTDIVSA